MKVTFLGAGLYGEALGKVAEVNDHEVRYYDPYRFPEIEISDAISGADVVVYVAPAEAYAEILPELDKNTPLILASKGFISTAPFESFKHFSVLGGAAFAEDIMEALGGKFERPYPIVLTASSELSEQLFTTDFMMVEHTDDFKGIMLCGALKNVYAIGGGLMMADGHPEQYLTEAFFEMQDILTDNGCNPDTATLSCGAPDLVISCTMDGRNFRFGSEIRMHPGSRVEPAGTVEGLNVILSLDKYPDFVWPQEKWAKNVKYKHPLEFLMDREKSLMARIVRAVKNATV